MIITNKYTITSTIPLAECDEDHLSRTSIKNIVNRLVQEDPSSKWVDHCKCAKCGVVANGYMEGEFETRNGQKESIRGFYLLSKKGNVHALLTFDHIWPRSLGGRDACWNGQVLCYDCNQKKSDVVSEEFVRYVLDHINKFISPCVRRRHFFTKYVQGYFPHLMLEEKYYMIFNIDYSLGVPIYDY